jgi:hypothetical protein
MMIRQRLREGVALFVMAFSIAAAVVTSTASPSPGALMAQNDAAMEASAASAQMPMHVVGHDPR